MFRINAYTAIAIIYFSVCILGVTHAQTNLNGQAIPNDTQTGKQISQAIAKVYNASVLIWEIDAETQARLSAQFSGVVVSADGIILSAAHVVMPGKTYKIMFPDGGECVAKGLGRITIPPTFMQPDAAMLKITDKGSWPFAQMGWSSSLTVNTPCISIAYPETLEQRKPTVRFGHITMLKNEHGFLQSSCIMEPGDSGGPLFDLLGRVIGIHSGIEVPVEVNYEVPIDTYRKFWDALNKPVDYKSLPIDTNVIAADPSRTVFLKSKTADQAPRQLGLNQKLLQSACVQISSLIEGKAQQIYGTLISVKELPKKAEFANRTLLVSKSSMVGDAPVIVLPGGRTVSTRVVSRNRENDLVLLMANETPGEGIKIPSGKNDTLAFRDLGTFLWSPMLHSEARVGVLGNMPINLPKITSYGYIGATTGFKGEQLIFTYVQPNSAAEIGGLKVGDVLKTVDGQPVEDELDFLKALKKYSAGDTTAVSIVRGGVEYKKPIVLKYPPQRISNHPAELFPGGKSIRRDGFQKVFVHDSAIKADECGGPVFDIDGRFKGINIARISRTSTLAMPATVVNEFVQSSLAHIKL